MPSNNIELTQPESLCFILSNCRSLFNKIDELRILADMNKPDFICITESWLNISHSDACVSISEYSIMRKDRPGKRGGGICVYHKSLLNVEQHHTQNTPSDSEILTFTCKNLIVFITYMPPNLSRIASKEIVDCIIDNADNLLIKYPTHHLVIMGDFNRHSISTLTDSLNLRNIITETTRHQASLDKCLIPKQISHLYRSVVKEPIANSDHNTIYIYHKAPSTQTLEHRDLLDLRESNLILFEENVSNIDWSQLFNVSDVDDKCNFFYKALDKCKQQIPKVRVKKSPKDKAWITPICKHLINLR